MSGFGHLFGALVFGRYHFSLLRILSYVYLIVLGVGAPIPLLIMHWNLAHVLLNFWLTPVWLLSFLVWLARRFFMESFSILALNRPLRWLGSDTWEALSNSFALNIWHTCRKTKESCCCRGRWSISFQFPIAFVFIFISIHLCVATTCWCDQGYRATHLPLTCPVGGKRPSVNHEPWTMNQCFLEDTGSIPAEGVLTHSLCLWLQAGRTGLTYHKQKTLDEIGK